MLDFGDVGLSLKGDPVPVGEALIDNDEDSCTGLDSRFGLNGGMHSLKYPSNHTRSSGPLRGRGPVGSMTMKWSRKVAGSGR